jgi:signal peptidase II
MNKRHLACASIFILAILVDQLTKKWGTTLPTLYFNQGFIMGLYSDLPENIRIVALSCFAGIIFFIYVFLIYVIPPRAQILKYGLSLLVGGMFGNVIDKIIYGKTIDFIPVNIFNIHTVFNFADIFLWCGTLMALYVLLRKERLVWYPNSLRGNYLIKPREQFKIGLNYALVVICCAVILGIFSYTFFNTTFAPYITTKNHLMLTYFITYSLITLLFCALAFLFGVIISHRSLGPIHAFDRYVNDLIVGYDRKLTFREGDNYKDLELVADRLRVYFNAKK